MRVAGVALARPRPVDPASAHTAVLLEASGRVARVERYRSLPAAAAEIAALVEPEPFLIGLDAPIVVPRRPGRTRPVERLVRRRLGVRLPASGRAAPGDAGIVAGESLLAGLAAAGQPCLPYPDRDRRRPGLAEIHPRLVLKALLWPASALAAGEESAARPAMFRAYEPPAHRAPDRDSGAAWTRRAAALDLLLAVLRGVEGLDLQPARDALAGAATRDDVERAAAVFDATLIAATALRYLEDPESCLFLGDPENGYTILPADPFIRRLALGGAGDRRERLFPRTSLRQQLGPGARLRPADLLDLPGRAPRTEAEFEVPPRYEFDNLDEMLWWKHCRHVGGPTLPTDGLRELTVALSAGPAAQEAPLTLARSRHRTLSFRFEPPAVWRTRLPARDGKTYPFAVLRAVYETAR